MIHATCHTADNVVCLEFDATPWFSEADAPSIVDLAQRGWSSTAIADSLERRRGYERLHDLVAYAAERLQPESLEDPTWETFECVVDGPDALAWLEKNRPDVVAENPEPRPVSALRNPASTRASRNLLGTGRRRGRVESAARARGGRCIVSWRGNGAPLRTKRAAVALECDFDSPGDAVVVAVG